MSAEQYFCAYCGHNSNRREVCTHCGLPIDDLYEKPPAFFVPLWGRMTLRLHDGEDRAQTWKELAEVWRTKVEATRPHKPSQLDQFNTSADTVGLYGADYMASLLRDALGSRGTVDFQELPPNEIPRAPKYIPLRPPTIPRNKR